MARAWLSLLFFCFLTLDAAPVEVYVLPHSHDDVGWVRTIDEYYDLFVRDIYTTAVKMLVQDRSRKFQSVEQAFFSRWYKEATPLQRLQVQQLVIEGRFEFVIGGWVMQDEACTDYLANIDQMTEGHRFIWDNFKVRPRFSFQVDPFGASITTPTHFAMMGFDGHIISRIPFEKKSEMQDSKSLEYVWRANPSLGTSTDIFTHVMDQYSYCSPGPVYWDGNNDPQHSDPSPPITSANIAAVAANLVANFQERSAWFRLPHLLWPWGCDFQHFNATVMFENMDKLIPYINQVYGDKFHLKYAVLSDYFDTVHKANLAWPLRTADEGDFFPYNDNEDSWWSGYFTSRNLLKGFMRTRAAVRRTMDQAYTLATAAGRLAPTGDWFQGLNSLHQALGEAQHHDGITGTCKPYVGDMYTDHLTKGTVDATFTGNSALSALVGLKRGDMDFSTDPEYLLHNLVSKRHVDIVVTNPLGWHLDQFISLNVSTKNVSVTHKTDFVQCQVSDSLSESGLFELSFLAKIPALGLNTYAVEVNPETGPLCAYIPAGPPADKEKANGFLSINNAVYTLTFDLGAGLLSSINNTMTGVEEAVSQSIMEYPSYTGSGQKSGNYIFRPQGPAQFLANNVPTITVVRGHLVSRVRQVFDSSHEQVWELFHDPSAPDHGESVDAAVHVVHKVGKLALNRECITRYSTSIATHGTIYTEGNGWQELRKVYNASKPLPIPGNYFPMVNFASLIDQSFSNEQQAPQLVLLGQRSHGVSSQSEGAIEVMLHRREGFDDSRGESIPMDDVSRVRPAFTLLLSTHEDALRQRRKAQQRLNFPPGVFFARDPLDAHAVTFLAPLVDEMPKNVNLLSLTPLGGDRRAAILRLEHLYETSEDGELSLPVHLDLEKLFAKDFARLTVDSERSLSTVWPKEDLHRWTWRIQGEENLEEDQGEPQPQAGPVITLYPKEIRTWFVTFDSA